MTRRSIHRRWGFSIPLALTAGGFLAIIISALSLVSSGEMRAVKNLLGKTTGEYSAYSGMIWAYEKLCREGRWYQPDGTSIENRGQQWKNSWSGTPDLKGEDVIDPAAKLTVLIDEVPSEKVVQLPKKTVNGGKGLQLLDHLKILSVVEAGGEKTVLFGKFIMMPEPLLNSNSVRGNFVEEDAVEPEQEYVVRVPPIKKKMTGFGAKIEPGYIWSQDCDLTDRVKIRTVLVSPGQSVKMEDYVITMNTEWDSGGTQAWATQEPKMRARYDGTVKDVRVKVGDVLREGDELCTIKKKAVQKSTQFPLLKLVRVIKLPPDLSRSLDLTKAGDRLKAYEYVAKQKEEFLSNFAAATNQENLKGIVGKLEALNAGKPRETVDEKDLNFPDLKTPGGNPGNTFVKDLLGGFNPPLGLRPGEVAQFIASAAFRLGVDKREITTQLRELLEIHGQHYHQDKDFYLRQMDTVPRKMLREGRDIYVIKGMKNEGPVASYIQLINDVNRPDDNAKVDEYITRNSQLDNAAIYANIYLNNGTPWDIPTFKTKVDKGEITDPENYFFWKNSKGEEGYWKYADEDDITLKKVPVPYTFETPMQLPNIGKKSADANDDPQYNKDMGLFRIRVDYLLRYFKKHFEEGSFPKKYDELRPDDDIEDTPQAPGPPDATGCIFSGVSS